MDQWLQIGLQIPVVALFTWFTLRIVRMFQEREDRRDEIRADERRELAGIVGNNTQALQQNSTALSAVADAVNRQATSARATDDRVDSVGDTVGVVLAKLEQHHQFVVTKLDGKR